MKTFFEFLEEQTRIYPDTPKVKQFGDDTKMKLLSKGIKPPEENPNRPVDTTGANSPFADPSVKSYTVSSDKPKIGTDDAVGKLLKQKGFDRSGKKLDARSVYHPDHEIAKRERGIIFNDKISDKVPSELPKSLRDKPPERKDSVALQRQMSGDKAPSSSSKDRLNMLRLKVDRQHAADDAKMNEPAKKSIQPKVGSLAVKQTGYPAAEKPKAPIPKAKPEQSEITIQKGQKIWDIAGGDPKRVKRILDLNPDLNPNKIPIGYKLKLK